MKKSFHGIEVNQLLKIRGNRGSGCAYNGLQEIGKQLYDGLK